jgi:hypothetical protein
MIKKTELKKQTPKQTTMFGTYEFPSYEEIMDAYAKEFKSYVIPKGDTIFGFWMQTLADLEFLDLELQGLTEIVKGTVLLTIKYEKKSLYYSNNSVTFSSFS